MTKPISDKAEIALEYPDKLYVGTFERSSRFEAHVEGFHVRADPRQAALWHGGCSPLLGWAGVDEAAQGQVFPEDNAMFKWALRSKPKHPGWP